MHTCPEPVHTTGLVDSWDWDMWTSWVSANKLHLAADDEDPPFPIPIPGVVDSLMNPCPAPVSVASWDMQAVWQLVEESISSEVMETEVMETELIDEP